MLTLRFNDDGQQQSKAAIFNLQHIAVVFVAVHFHWQQREKKITHFWEEGTAAQCCHTDFRILKDPLAGRHHLAHHTHNNHLLKESAFIGNVNNNTQKSQDDLQVKHFFFVGPDSGKCQRQLRGRSARQQQLASVPCSSSLLYSYVSLLSPSLLRMFRKRSISSRLTSKKKEEHHALLRFLRFALSLSLCEYWTII